MKKTVLLTLATFTFLAVFSQTVNKKNSNKTSISSSQNTQPLPGAYQLQEYLPLLKGKRVGIFANNTSTVGDTHLVDTLQKLGIKITKIFGPEHGFRGTASAGEKIDNYTDEQTHIPVISLYGKKRKVSQEDVADVDVMLFDIQDVGVRFYTYISSLQEFMESAIQFNKPLIILDRPNPNGSYVDGPVLDTTFRSFVGMQPVPVVYGMTIGEYAKFLVGENLLNKDGISSFTNSGAGKSKKDGTHLNMIVIKCRSYSHESTYSLPIKPSPNLPDDISVYWYPSTCFFEGTVLSEGRGTDHPFVIFGHPSLPKTMYAFTPVSNPGAKNPKLENKLCYGWNLSGQQMVQGSNIKLELKYLLEAYKLFPDKENFFIVPKKDTVKPADIFFNKLAGNAELMQQIKAGKSEQVIRSSWEPKLSEFKIKRKKYLLYPDAL
jgi:uncharacterized protein YbbC (DUF1343 family)